MKSFLALGELTRFEQILSIKRGKYIDIKETPSFNALSEKEKKEFLNYFDHKKIIRKTFYSLIAVIFIFAILIRPEISGNIIGGREGNASLVSIFLFILGIILVIALFAYNYSKYVRKEKLRSYVRIAEKHM